MDSFNIALIQPDDNLAATYYMREKLVDWFDGMNALVEMQVIILPLSTPTV